MTESLQKVQTMNRALFGLGLLASVICIRDGRMMGEEPSRDLTCDARLMTFNIRYNNPGDGENAWPHRKDEVARLIDRHADIAGLQEALPGQIEDLEKSLPQFDWYGVGRDDGDRQGEFCPVFYRRDRFELLERKTWWLSETPDVPGSKSWDAAITRLVTYVRLRDRQRGGEINILNTHFDHVGAAAREASARLIRQGVAGLEAGTPLVVMGDLNCTPDQTPYQILTRADAGDASAPLVDTITLSRQAPEGPDSTWNAFRAVVPGRRIDFILVGPGVEVAGHRTLTDRINGRFPSDHLPVVADLIFTAWHATP